MVREDEERHSLHLAEIAAQVEAANAELRRAEERLERGRHERRRATERFPARARADLRELPRRERSPPRRNTLMFEFNQNAIPMVPVSFGSSQQAPESRFDAPALRPCVFAPTCASRRSVSASGSTSTSKFDMQRPASEEARDRDCSVEAHRRRASGPAACVAFRRSVANHVRLSCPSRRPRTRAGRGPNERLSRRPANPLRQREVILSRRTGTHHLACGPALADKSNARIERAASPWPDGLVSRSGWSDAA